MISEMSGADVGCEFRLYFASVSSQPLTVRNKKTSRVFVAAAALFGVPGKRRSARNRISVFRKWLRLPFS